ncbi:hypothetical protein NDU88_001739 [Pleurodeles waltl]|uniref:Myb-like domain-containing protein n=1 Tax=Pleurodeles waltl TaxID=8319 RepID=A0AAV7VXM1_PLEWA|nr:hypothetical protein NDU88_001739 [Pleurodeles waltl]
MRRFLTQYRQKKLRTLPVHQRRAKMDPRCHYRPQEDDSRPGTSQEDPHKNQDTFKKKRKCRFSAEEQEILVKEVTEHQHQLFVTSRLPISRREAIWQQIVDKINSVAEVRRTVIECKKRWHDCKRRTKEKMARNRKAALQTGGGGPAHQEALDHMKEMVAAVIPEEIVTGIQGQDSADYQETTHMQGRPPKSRRQVTVPRSKDRSGNSDFPAGLAGGLPAQRERGFHDEAGSESSRRSGSCATGAVAPVAYFTVCAADSEIHLGAPLRGPRDPPYRHPVPGGRTAGIWMAVGGVGIPSAAQQAAPPWRIQWGGGTLAGDRQCFRSDRGFTAAVGIPIGAPPACRRCSRGPPPWRSLTARVRMTALVFILKFFFTGTNLPVGSDLLEPLSGYAMWVSSVETFTFGLSRFFEMKILRPG